MPDIRRAGSLYKILVIDDEALRRMVSAQLSANYPETAGRILGLRPKARKGSRGHVPCQVWAAPAVLILCRGLDIWFYVRIGQMFGKDWNIVLAGYFSS